MDCDIHLVPFVESEGCAYCLRFLADPPDTSQMTAAMRVLELEQWLTAPPSVPRESLYRRIEMLLDRMVSLHELADPDALLREAMRPRRNDPW